jgi:hypothetical protein
LETALSEVCDKCGQAVRQKKAPRIPPVVQKHVERVERIKPPKVIGAWE